MWASPGDRDKEEPAGEVPDCRVNAHIRAYLSGGAVQELPVLPHPAVQDALQTGRFSVALVESRFFYFCDTEDFPLRWWLSPHLLPERVEGGRLVRYAERLWLVGGRVEGRLSGETFRLLDGGWTPGPSLPAECCWDRPWPVAHGELLCLFTAAASVAYVPHGGGRWVNIPRPRTREGLGVSTGRHIVLVKWPRVEVYDVSRGTLLEFSVSPLIDVGLAEALWCGPDEEVFVGGSRGVAKLRPLHKCCSLVKRNEIKTLI